MGHVPGQRALRLPPGRLAGDALRHYAVAVEDGRPIGLLQYEIIQDQCEVLVLIAARPRHGVGTVLLNAVCTLARENHCRRLWLVTTNNNQAALDFYRSLGCKQVAVYPGAARQARAIKPEIPTHDENGTRIEDEIEFEISLKETQN